MKLAYFINQYPGISHSFIRREIQALERENIDVARFAIRPSKDDIIAAEDIAEAAKTRHIVTSGGATLLATIAKQAVSNPAGAVRALGKALSIGWRSEAGLLRHLFYFGEALVLADWLRQANLHHVHVHFGTNAATIAMIAAPLANATYSLTVHGPEEFEKPALISLSEKIKTATFTVAISKFGASQLKKLVSPDLWPRIKIVHCGLERDFYDNADNKVIAAPSFVCTGRLCAEKGQIDLVEAVARVAGNHPDIKITLIGDGPMRGAIEDTIRKHGIEKNVILAGWKTPSEVREHLLGARAFVLPSYAEGLPVSIMEALALRRPVISTYVAGIPELVVPDVCGWLTPAGDVDAIAAALIAAMGASDEVIARMGEDGRRRVVAAHDIDGEAKKLGAHFSSALERAS